MEKYGNPPPLSCECWWCSLFDYATLKVLSSRITISSCQARRNVIAISDAMQSLLGSAARLACMVLVCDVSPPSDFSWQWAKTMQLKCRPQRSNMCRLSVGVAAD